MLGLTSSIVAKQNHALRMSAHTAAYFNAVQVPIMQGIQGHFPHEFCLVFISNDKVNGIVHPKMKILSLITHPHVRKTFVHLLNTS